MTQTVNPPAPGAGANGSGTPLPTATTLKVALAVLGIYVVLVGLLIYLRTDQEWDRLIYLLTGFEAIVFAAIGWIFGTSVARGAVQDAKNAQAEAKEQAAAAKEEASAARESAETARAERDSTLQDAERGRAIAASIKAKAPRSSRLGARPEDSVPSSELAELQNLAERLFPDKR
jgi:hypothetical protein